MPNMIFVDPGDKLRIAALRRKAKRLGMNLLRSSGVRHANNLGGFKLVADWYNSVFAGDKYDLDLDGASQWIDYFETLSLNTLRRLQRDGSLPAAFGSRRHPPL